MDDIISLIAEIETQDPDTGIWSTEDGSPRSVFCRVSSVDRTEYYKAQQIGTAPEIKVITQTSNYDGETIAEYNGERYKIYRTYNADGNDEIELYLERDTKNG